MSADVSKEGGKPAVAARNGRSDSSPRPLTPHDYPELIFGLVGPVGTDLDPVVDALTGELRSLGYEVATVRLSKLIAQFLGADYGAQPRDVQLEKLMNDGTRIRVTAERGDAVAWLGIAEIQRLRKEQFSGKGQRNAYIVRSLKHPQEIQTLRHVYGRGFLAISVYAPRDVRVTALADEISKSRHGKSAKSRSIAEQLIERDELEEGASLGQDVKDAFPLADLFVDGRNRVSVERQTTRFVHLLFGHPFLTPSREEYGMYHARSAALRSADLGRQVGATILSPEGDLISVGCNDVPKAGGGLYWEGDEPDCRDFQEGSDATSDHREQLLGELLDGLYAAGIARLPQEHEGQGLEAVRQKIPDLVAELTRGKYKSRFKGMQVMNLLEFGRSVHAEMAALMAASRRGISVRGATLFTTTFPCHMCARHIVAAGIDRVVYIEPYSKSRARQLHEDSIIIDPSGDVRGKVRFEPFVGIAPRQYLEIFDARDARKDAEGKPVDWRTMQRKPRFLRFMKTYLDLENAIVASELPALAVKLGVAEKLEIKPG